MNDADKCIECLLNMKAKLPEDEQGCIDDVARVFDDMKEQIRSLLFRVRQFYRRKSEKVSVDQIPLAFLLETTVSASVAGENPEKQEGGAPEEKTDKGDGEEKKPREVEDVYPSAEQLQCDEHGESMQEIKVVVRKQIVYKPAEVYLLEEHVHVYECQPCGYDNPVVGPVTPKLIENGLPSSSLLSHIVTAKVVDSTPLERVARQLSRHGADIATARLYDWFGQVGDAVSGFGRYAQNDLLLSTLISLDDTPYVFKQGDQKGPKKGRIWLYIGDNDRIAFCQFTEDWKGGHRGRP